MTLGRSATPNEGRFVLADVERALGSLLGKLSKDGPTTRAWFAGVSLGQASAVFGQNDGAPELFESSRALLAASNKSSRRLPGGAPNADELAVGKLQQDALQYVSDGDVGCGRRMVVALFMEIRARLGFEVAASWIHWLASIGVPCSVERVPPTTDEDLVWMPEVRRIRAREQRSWQADGWDSFADESCWAPPPLASVAESKLGRGESVRIRIATRDMEDGFRIGVFFEEDEHLGCRGPERRFGDAVRRSCENGHLRWSWLLVTVLDQMAGFGVHHVGYRDWVIHMTQMRHWLQRRLRAEYAEAPRMLRWGSNDASATDSDERTVASMLRAVTRGIGHGDPRAFPALMDKCWIFLDEQSGGDALPLFYRWVGEVGLDCAIKLRDPTCAEDFFWIPHSQLRERHRETRVRITQFEERGFGAPTD